MVSHVRIAEHCHAEQRMPGVPDQPVFAVHDVSAVTDSAGAIQIHCVGRGAPLEAMEGMELLFAYRGRSLVFGAVHPRWVDGADAPFREIFTVPSDERVAGICVSAGRVDLTISDRLGSQQETYIFTYVDWDEFMTPPAWVEYLASLLPEQF